MRLAARLAWLLVVGALAAGCTLDPVEVLVGEDAGTPSGRVGGDVPTVNNLDAGLQATDASPAPADARPGADVWPGADAQVPRDGQPSPPRDATVPPPIDAATRDVGSASPDAMTVIPIEGTYAAKLARTQPVKFGGLPYCTYVVTMLEVNSSLTLDRNGVATAATVTNIMDETPFDTCPHGTIGRKKYAFTLFSSSRKGQDIIIEYRGDPTNVPKSSLTFTGTVSAGTFTGTFLWQRTDITTPSLAWTVKAGLTHVRQ